MIWRRRVCKGGRDISSVPLLRWTKRWAGEATLRKKLAAQVHVGFRKDFPKILVQILEQCKTALQTVFTRWLGSLYIQEIKQSLPILLFCFVCHCLFACHSSPLRSPAAFISLKNHLLLPLLLLTSRSLIILSSIFLRLSPPHNLFTTSTTLITCNTEPSKICSHFPLTEVLFKCVSFWNNSAN